jgi:hypothetical protein
LFEDINSCEFFSIQLDESTDAVDIAQLFISIKMVSKDFSQKNIFKTSFIQRTAQGKDIYLLFKSFAVENKIPLQKLSSITMDGAPAMIGKKRGKVPIYAAIKIYG